MLLRPLNAAFRERWKSCCRGGVRGVGESWLRKFKTYSVGDIGISSITVAELHYGVEKSKYGARNRRAVELFLTPLAICDFDAKAAQIYGSIRADLESKGTPIGPLDTLIAAQALSLGVTLVTNNIKEFSRVPSLKLVNWAT